MLNVLEMNMTKTHDETKVIMNRADDLRMSN